MDVDDGSDTPDKPRNVTGRKEVIITTNHRTDPYWSDETAALYVGDARQLLAEMPDCSVDCLVTSPPYWAKRDYRVPGQYGHEPTPAAYADTLRATFAEARRVLADDGTCWLNIGDSYGQGWTGTSPAPTRPKDLLGLPWRVAFALQEDGWMIRNAIVWHKPNAMPESVRDRLNCRYEMIFLLVKSRRYWCSTSTPSGSPTATRSHRHPPGSVPRTLALAVTPLLPNGCRTVTPRPNMARTRPNCSPAAGGSASRCGPETSTTRPPIRTDGTPATSGPSRRGPIRDRISPPSPSTSRSVASRPDADRAVPSPTRSAASARPAWPPRLSAADSSASNCPPSSPPSPPTGSATPAAAERKVITTRDDSTNPHHSGGMTTAELLALPVAVDVGTAARALGIGRSTGYELARRGEFPCRVLRVGGSYRVPTADLLRVLGIDLRAWVVEPNEPNPLPPAA